MFQASKRARSTPKLAYSLMVYGFKDAISMALDLMKSETLLEAAQSLSSFLFAILLGLEEKIKSLILLEQS